MAGWGGGGRVCEVSAAADLGVCLGGGGLKIGAIAITRKARTAAIKPEMSAMA